MNYTSDPDFDPRIADWLEDDPVLAPSTIFSTVMAAYPSIAQRHPWRVRWRSPDVKRLAVVAAPVAFVVLTFAILAIPRPAEVPGGEVTPSLAPSASAGASASVEPTSSPATSSAGFAETFVHPFEYSVPIGSELSVTTASPQMHALTVSTRTSPSFGYDPLKGVRGITFALGTRASTHKDLGRADVPLEPETFFTDLQANPALDVGPATAVEVGGLAAVQADTDHVDNRSYPDVHIDPLGSPPPGEAAVLALKVPGRLSVAVMSDGFLIVHVWAVNEEELAAWLPEADQLIDSMRFLDEP